ncbi:hypothetical protein Dimus_038462 [Dionaea muscipula]
MNHRQDYQQRSLVIAGGGRPTRNRCPREEGIHARPLLARSCFAARRRCPRSTSAARLLARRDDGSPCTIARLPACPKLKELAMHVSAARMLFCCSPAGGRCSPKRP